MKRRYLSDLEKLEMQRRQDYLCAICHEPLTAIEYDHSTPHAFRPERKPDQAVCIPCHRAKSKQDVKSIAKARRLHRTFILGEKPKRKTIQSRPFDRRWRKRMDGSVVPRNAA